MSATTWGRPGAAAWSCRQPGTPIEENAFYRAGELLVGVGTDASDVVREVLDRLERLGVRAEPLYDDERQLPGRPVRLHLATPVDPLAVVLELGEDLPVAPHYLVGFTMGWFFKPGDEVRLATRHGCLYPYDERLRGAVPVARRHERRRVLVIDTGVAGGWPSDYQPRPAGDADPLDVCDPVHGHGTFIAGIIANIAPDAEVTVLSPVDDLDSFTPPKSGEEVRYVDELAVFDWLAQTARETDADHAPDVINMSFGTYGAKFGDRIVAPVALLAALETAVEHWPDTRIVAAVGNEGIDVDVQPFFPAAYSWGAGGASEAVRAAVVSVGGLDHDGTIAEWGVEDGMPRGSNRGERISSWVLGQDVVSAFPAGDGGLVYATWSGTSFATAVATGLLAAGSAVETAGARAAVVPGVELHRSNVVLD